MPRTELFTSLAEVRTEKELLRRELDRARADLRTQVELVGDPEFRRALAGDAFGDMLQAWQPLRSVKKLLGNSPTMTSGALGMLFGEKALTPFGRLLIAIATAALPIVMERIGKDPGRNSEKLFEELGVSWERVKNYVRERRAAHNEDQQT